MESVESQLKRKLNMALQAVSIDVVDELKSNVAVDTNALRKSIKGEVNDLTLTISMLDYGKYVEWGTPPHIIKPKDKQALKFKSGGDTIFAKEVHHPGTRPQPFIRPMINNKLIGFIKKRFYEQK